MESPPGSRHSERLSELEDSSERSAEALRRSLRNSRGENKRLAFDKVSTMFRRTHANDRQAPCEFRERHRGPAVNSTVWLVLEYGCWSGITLSPQSSGLNSLHSNATECNKSRQTRECLLPHRLDEPIGAPVCGTEYPVRLTKCFSGSTESVVRP